MLFHDPDRDYTTHSEAIPVIPLSARGGAATFSTTSSGIQSSGDIVLRVQIAEPLQMQSSMEHSTVKVAAKNQFSFDD